MVRTHKQRKKPSKPYPSFPLTPHNNGQWCKKIRGRIHFFGVWEDSDAALQRYLRVAGVERSFREVRRRTRVIGRFPTEMSALSLIWSVMDQDSRRWHGLVMDAEHIRLVTVPAKSLAKKPIEVKGLAP